MTTAARQLRRVRTEALAEMKGGLRALYRTLELPSATPLKDAHAALDAAVLAVAQRLEKAEPATPPGIPATFPEPETLISDDCIRPPALTEIR